MIDFALSETKESNPIDKLAAYVGHSEGTTQFFIGETLMPQYFAEHVNLYVAFAPVVRLDHANMGPISAVADQLTYFIRLLHLYNLIDLKDQSFAVVTFCKALPTTCEYLDEGIWDMDATVDNTGREYVKFANTPAGAGWKNVIHYAQIIKSSRFQRWDYGSDEENKKHYGSTEPPQYDLAKCSVPTGIFTGDIDRLSTP